MKRAKAFFGTEAFWRFIRAEQDEFGNRNATPSRHGSEVIATARGKTPSPKPSPTPTWPDISKPELRG
jgi:hypothetical protein